MSSIVIVTKKGKIIRFDGSELPKQKRGGVGIKPMTLMQGDEIVSMVVVEEEKKKC